MYTHTPQKKTTKSTLVSWGVYINLFFVCLFKPYWAHATAQEPLLTEAMGLIGDGEPLVAP